MTDNFCVRSITGNWVHRSATHGQLRPRSKRATRASWYDAWSSYADRLYDLAVKSHAAGHRVSARNAFLRASNYYRSAYIFMFALPIDPRVIDAYQKQTDSFQKGAVLFEQPIDVLKIPYRDTTLPGYFIKPDASNTPRKTLLCAGGYDGTCKELFFMIATQTSSTSRRVTGGRTS